MADEKPTRIDVTVKLPKKEKPGEAPSGVKPNNEWPWRIFRDDDNPAPRLTLEFFDATTAFNPVNDEFKDHKIYSGTEAEFEQVYEETSEGVVTIKQNKRVIPTDEEYQKLYLNGGIPYSDKTSLFRMEKADYENNGQVWPVGVLKPNLEATLKNSSGATHDLLDYISHYQGSSRGRIDESKPELVYEWVNPQLLIGDLKIRERTSASILLQVEQKMQMENGLFTGNFSKKCAQETLEGIFWNIIDTSDRDNFKVTAVPVYDCEEKDEWKGNLLSLRGNTKVKVFLTRRKWFALLQFDVDGGIKNYGVNFLPPLDFEMPPARKTGTWELCGTYSQALWGSSYGYQWVNEDFQHWVLNLDGDSERLNALYMAQFENFSLKGIWGPYSEGGCDPQDNVMTEGWFVWKKGTDAQHSKRVINSLKIAREGYDAISPLVGSGTIFHTWRPSTCSPYFCQSLPDGKVPHMATKGKFSILDVTNRECFIYDKDALPSEGKTKIDALLDSIYKHPFFDKEKEEGNFPQKSSLRSWSVAVGAAKARELVAVMDIPGQTLFVWRKTDEQLDPEITFPYDGTYPVQTQTGSVSWTGYALKGSAFWQVSHWSLAGTSNQGDCSNKTCGPEHRPPDPFPVDTVLGNFHSRTGQLCLEWSNVNNRSLPKKDLLSWRKFTTWGCWVDPEYWICANATFPDEGYPFPCDSETFDPMADYCCYEHSEEKRPLLEADSGLIAMGTDFVLMLYRPKEDLE